MSRNRRKIPPARFHANRIRRRMFHLAHGLRQVGLERPCWSPPALALLASASGGVPRLLNLLARAAWIAAAQAGVNTIGPEQVQTALNLVPAARDKINP